MGYFKIMLILMIYIIVMVNGDNELWSSFPKTYRIDWSQVEKNVITKELKKGAQTVWSLDLKDKQYQKRRENLTEQSVTHLARTIDNSFYTWSTQIDGDTIMDCKNDSLGATAIPNTFQWIKNTNHVGACPAPYDQSKYQLYVLMGDKGITTICLETNVTDPTIGSYSKPIYFDFKGVDGNLLQISIEVFDVTPPKEEEFNIPKECFPKKK
eukprot:TRINITY_DN10432_c0_g1_i1.p1 TRINITY_DN10432_c0_g1~~TRINITY_DN10432_c0_g1_i1.p1  ORF type:complete len:211 (+),score=48.28 TRINITY_DN10432_c0_g1_i1:64-696(+)